MKNSLPEQFHSVFVFFNGKATNSTRARRLIKDLQKLLPAGKLKTIEITGFDPEKTKQLTAETARKFDGNTLLVIAGGDGTVSAIIESLLLANKLTKTNRSVAVLPVWGGNGNVMSIMLNGNSPTKLERTLEHSRIVPVYQLRVRVTPPGSKPFVRLGSVIGFGATAHASLIIDRVPRHTSKRRIKSFFGLQFLDEAKHVVRAFSKVQAFRIERNGRIERKYELLFANGPRVAKLNGLPVSLDEKAYYETYADKGSLFILLYAAKAMIGKNHGFRRTDTQSFVVQDDILAQVDGESVEIPAGSQIQIGLHNRPFQALSSKLKPRVD